MGVYRGSTRGPEGASHLIPLPVDAREVALPVGLLLERGQDALPFPGGVRGAQLFPKLLPVNIPQPEPAECLGHGIGVLVLELTIEHLQDGVRRGLRQP